MTEIVPLPASTRLDDTLNPLAQGVMAVSRAAAIDVVGNDDYALSPADLVLLFGTSQERTGRIAAAVDGDDVVGYATLTTFQPWMPTVAELHVAVHPQHRRFGFGGRLLAWAEGEAAAAGRSALQTYVEALPCSTGMATVEAPTGGVFPSDVPGLAFARRHGYTLEQIESNSVLSLPVADLQVMAWRDEASAHAAGYRVHVWMVPLPDVWLFEFAVLRTDVTANLPTAGLETATEAWDANRLRQRWREWANAGFECITVCAEDVATGHLVGFTQLTWREHPPEAAFQGYTFVEPAHRGHRLGLLLKAAALGELMARQPTVRRIHTENATENAPMLAINRRMGFRPNSVAAILQKRTTETAQDAPAFQNTT